MADQPEPSEQTDDHRDGGYRSRNNGEPGQEMLLWSGVRGSFRGSEGGGFHDAGLITFGRNKFGKFWGAR